MKSRIQFLRGICVSALILQVGTGPAHAFLGGLLDQKTETKSGNAKIEGADTYKGVKHAVGVRDFDNEAGWSGRWELGNNMSTMLESALYDSGRFVVVEREKLDVILQEQNLAASGRAAPSKVAQTGKLRSARYIATGAITEVAYNESGSDAGISIKGVRLGGGSNKAKVALVVKLVDSTTGEVVAKENVVGEAGSRRIRVGVNFSGFGGDLGGFNKTPLGEAAQDCIIQAVEFLAKQMEEYPLEGSIVRATEDGKVIINRGADYGISVGQSFEVRVPGEQLIDPDTGAVLGVEEGQVKCSIKISKVDEKMSHGEVASGTNPDRGDVVVLAKP